MDPGSPKIQDVVKQYGTDFEAKNPGTKVDIQFVPWAQAHDKFVTAIAGGKVPDVAEMGTTWTPEFADQGGLVEQPKIAEGEYVSSLVDAATLNDKVYGKPWYAGARVADLPQGHAREGRRRAAHDLGRDDGRGQGDRGQGRRRRVPGRLHRPQRAHVPADDLAGRRSDRHPGRRDAGSPRSTRPRRPRRSTTTRRSTRRASTPRPRSAGRSPTRRPRSPTATWRC